MIECWDESQWTALCEAIGDSDLANDPRFATIDARLENRAALNERVAKFTRGRTPYQVMRALQRAGFPPAWCSLLRGCTTISTCVAAGSLRNRP